MCQELLETIRDSAVLQGLLHKVKYVPEIEWWDMLVIEGYFKVPFLTVDRRAEIT